MDRLARYIIILGATAIVALVAWYFRSILIYIAVAAVISMIGKPIVNLLCRIKFRKIQFPRWAAAALTLTMLTCICLSLFLLLAPMIGELHNTFSSMDINKMGNDVKAPLEKINQFIIKSFPSVEDDFRIELYLIGHMKSIMNLNTFSNILVSVTSFIVDFAIAIFSVLFISFFMMMENGILSDTIVSVLPSKYEEKTRRAMSSINRLLSRYFVGISLESLFVALLNSLGLIFIAKMNPTLAIVIGFTSGILNIIPYVGPLIGDILALVMGMIFHINYGIEMAMLPYLIIILLIFIFTQFIDNYVFQPLIYSNSVKAHPLEIFLVILVAGHIGGVFGILIAIPAYTVIRVIAAEFLSRYDIKIIQKLSRSIGNDNSRKE